MNERYEQGLKMLAEVDGKAGEEVLAVVQGICPDMVRYLIEFPFGDVYARPGLSLRDREIATLGMLAAKGGCLPQFKVHVRAGLHVGLSQKEILEIIIQTAVYAGFPAALNALFAANEVFQAEEEA
ncbi:MAG: carboxymuconolactone decarboxylase family protein [Desulfovibrionaceae bacterium]